MKKLLTAVLLLCICTTAAFAANFTTVQVEDTRTFDDLTWEQQLSTKLRYTDDQTPIPLCCTSYDGMVSATIPAEYANRSVEIYSAPKVEFTDYTPENYGFFSIQELSRTGVMTGDNRGNANPDQPITRAEAAVILVRMLGVPLADGAGSGFVDVPESAWYAPAMQTAKEYGIISADRLFVPDRSVSRQEFTAMLARAFSACGMLNAGTDATLPEEIRDADQIAAWALPAYRALQGIHILTYSDQSTESVTIAYAEPDQAATRAECAGLLTDAMEQLSVYPSKTALALGFGATLPVIDGSTSALPLIEQVYTALYRNGLRNVPTISKTQAAYTKLINGEADMLLAGAVPSTEVEALAREKGVAFEMTPIAYEAMVFFTNKDNPATGLSSQQITDIYTKNEAETWSALGGTDAKLYPFCRNQDSGSQALLNRYFLKGQKMAASITQETSASMASILTDVADVKTRTPAGYGLGYSVYNYYQNSAQFYGTDMGLKLLAVDGIAPTKETITGGSYPLSDYIYAVVRKDAPADAPIRKLMDFLVSDNGKSFIESGGFIPLQ